MKNVKITINGNQLDFDIDDCEGDNVIVRGGTYGGDVHNSSDDDGDGGGDDGGEV